MGWNLETELWVLSQLLILQIQAFLSVFCVPWSYLSGEIANTESLLLREIKGSREPLDTTFLSTN